MKNLHTFVLIACLPMLVAFSCGSKNEDIQHRLGSLLNNPSHETLENWKNANGSGLEDCEQNGGFNNESRAKLFVLISSGNIYALQAGLLAFSCWGGGELGDFYRSVGEFFDKRPHEFIRLAAEYRVDEYRLKRMISMLPLELVDNFDGQIELINHRIALLQNIKDSDVNFIIKSLKEGRSIIERAKKEMQ